MPPNDFERRAIQRLIDKANSIGVDVPQPITALACSGQRNEGAVLWLRANPDWDGAACCWGDTLDPAGCTCWIPVFDLEQATPCPPSGPDDIGVQTRMCDDCAFRKDSPERATPYSEETLFDLAATAVPFYCHDGMRRPVRWEHPDGRTIDGSPDDWQPAIINGMPYRADGRPGLLCAGWATRASRAAT